MADVSMVAQKTQIGVEATAGTAVAATQSLTAVGIAMGGRVETSTFRPMGRRYNRLVIPGKEWAEGSIDGLLDFQHLPYLLCASVKNVTPVDDGDDGKIWTWQPSGAGGDAIKTLTIEQGDATRAQQYAYGHITDLSFTIDRSEARVGGTLIARRMTDNNALTGSVPDLVEQPIIPANFDVKIASTQAGLDAAAVLTRTFRAEFSLGGLSSPIWPLNSSFTSFAAHIESEVDASFSLTMEADTAGMAQLTNLRAGSTYWVRIANLGPVIPGTVASQYEFVLDVACKVEGDPEFDAEEDVKVINWSNAIVDDATAGFPWSLTLTNTLAAL